MFTGPVVKNISPFNGSKTDAEILNLFIPFVNWIKTERRALILAPLGMQRKTPA